MPRPRRTVKTEQTSNAHVEITTIHVESSPETVKSSKNHEIESDFEGFATEDGTGVPETPFMNQRRSMSSASKHITDMEDEVGSNTSIPRAVQDGDLSMAVAKRTELMVEAQNDLHKFGVNHEVGLPEMIVVGDQSSGKSSLLAALIETYLPRMSGTCTRCPLHVKTSPGPVWKCKVSLELSYSFVSTKKRFELRDVTPNDPFPPWKLDQLHEVPFKTIYDMRELETTLQWAQVAILNPSRPPTRYIPGNTDFAQFDNMEHEAKFSPNVISAEISKPGLPSLSFFDLPGIIQDTEDGDEYLIEVIKNIVRMYIERPNAIIVLAMPITVDRGVSSAGGLVKAARAHHRCVGVLTKADRLSTNESHAQWDAVFERKHHRLGYGYFVTSQIPSLSTNFDENFHVKSRLEEEKFFSTQAPWNGEWAKYSDCFGTKKLSMALSKLLADQMFQSIPEIDDKVSHAILKIDAKLKNLPELPIEEIKEAILSRLGSFSRDVQCFIQGGSNNNKFRSSWSKLSDQFRSTIFDLRPIFIATHPSDGMERPEVIEIIDIDDDDHSVMVPSSHTYKSGIKEEEDASPCPPPKVIRLPDGSVRIKRPAPFGNTPSTPVQNGGYTQTGFTPNSGPRTMQPSVKPNSIQSPFDSIYRQIKQRGPKHTIASIRNQLDENQDEGVPGSGVLEVKKLMWKQGVEVWDQPLELFHDLTVQMIRIETFKVLDNVFSDWKKTELYKQSCVLLREFFSEFSEKQGVLNRNLYELETYVMFTKDHEGFNRNLKDALRALTNHRRAARVKAMVDAQVRNGLQIKDPEGRKKAEAKITDAQLGEDNFKVEVETAAWVRAMYLTVAVRFTDSVLLSINGTLFRHAKEGIWRYLEKQLRVEDGKERCAELMEEDERVGLERKKLKDEKERLLGFKERLAKLQLDNAALSMTALSTDGPVYDEEYYDTMDM